MALDIKLTNSPGQQIRLGIDGIIYTLIFRFNRRGNGGGYWTFDIGYSDGPPIYIGIKMVPSQNLTWRYDYSNIIGGSFFCLKNRDVPDRVEFNSFSSGDFSFVFMTNREQIALGIYGQVNLL